MRGSVEYLPSIPFRDDKKLAANRGDRGMNYGNADTRLINVIKSRATLI